MEAAPRLQGTDGTRTLIVGRVNGDPTAAGNRLTDRHYINGTSAPSEQYRLPGGARVSPVPVVRDCGPSQESRSAPPQATVTTNLPDGGTSGYTGGASWMGSITRQTRQSFGRLSRGTPDHGRGGQPWRVGGTVFEIWLGVRLRID